MSALWESDEIELLRSCKTFAEACKKLSHRTPKGIECKARILGIRYKPMKIRNELMMRKIWTPEKLMRLQRLREEGCTIKEIARQMGFAVNCIQSAIHNYNLPKKRPPRKLDSQVRPPTKKWPGGWFEDEPAALSPRNNELNGKPPSRHVPQIQSNANF